MMGANLLEKIMDFHAGSVNRENWRVNEEISDKVYSDVPLLQVRAGLLRG